jgi:hypothetical protein
MRTPDGPIIEKGKRPLEIASRDRPLRLLDRTKLGGERVVDGLARGDRGGGGAATAAGEARGEPDPSRAARTGTNHGRIGGSTTLESALEERDDIARSVRVEAHLQTLSGLLSGRLRAREHRGLIVRERGVEVLLVPCE